MRLLLSSQQRFWFADARAGSRDAVGPITGLVRAASETPEATPRSQRNEGPGDQHRLQQQRYVATTLLLLLCDFPLWCHNLVVWQGRKAAYIRLFLLWEGGGRSLHSQPGRSCSPFSTREQPGRSCSPFSTREVMFSILNQGGLVLHSQPGRSCSTFSTREVMFSILNHGGHVLHSQPGRSCSPQQGSMLSKLWWGGGRRTHSVAALLLVFFLGEECASFSDFGPPTSFRDEHCVPSNLILS